jgi:hypothetical protein
VIITMKEAAIKFPRAMMNKTEEEVKRACLVAH